jgi:hypothetical protein
MLKKRTSRLGVTMLGVLAAALVAVAPSALASHAGGKATTIRIWTDQDRKAAVDKVTSAWARTRGVDVQVVLPGPHIDKRFVQLAAEAQYQALLEAGVKIWTYQPTMLHAKVMTVDGVIANVGSANFDSRSLVLDDEVNLVVFDPAVVAELDRDFDEDVTRSKPIGEGNWEHRSAVQKVKEGVVGLIEEHL